MFNEKLHSEYMELSHVRIGLMTIKQRKQLNKIVKELMIDASCTEHDRLIYYQPVLNSFESDCEFIKSSVKNNIAREQALIGMAKQRIGAQILRLEE